MVFIYIIIFFFVYLLFFNLLYMVDYSFIEEEGGVGCGVDVYDYVDDIAEELGVSSGRVLYVLEFMILYSSYVMGLGCGFRFRDFMIYPDLRSIDFAEMVESDELGSMIMDRDRSRVYCEYMNMDYDVYCEYRNRGYMMRHLDIRDRKKILRRMRVFDYMKRLGMRRDRVRLHKKIGKKL